MRDQVTAVAMQSTSTLHQVSAMSMPKNEQTPVNSPFKAATTGTHSHSMVNGAKYYHGPGTPGNETQKLTVQANSLFPNFLSFFYVDPAKNDIQKCTVSIQQILYEQRDDELTSK